VRAGLAAAALVIGLGGCSAAAPPSVREGELRYVALGDSYTIGTSVSAADSWPSQLVAREPRLQLAANLGVNGYSSDDLIRYELPSLNDLRPDFVTLQIGVNDVVRGVPEVTYRANLEEILSRVIAAVPANRVLCVATPDYTVTPQGAAFGSPAQQRAGIARVNQIMGEACTARAIRYVPDIFTISEAATTDLSLVAGDGLHPSGAQYKRWVDVVAPAVEALLGG
jgi:acyl-CoA thioesterase-1